MRLAFLYLSLSILISCSNNERKIYKSIDPSVYAQYKIIDTIYKTKDYIATKCEDSVKHDKAYVTLIKKVNGKYYLLDPEAHFENDSTIIYYSMPLRADSENGSFQKNGIWFYALFYTEKINSTGIYQKSEKGVKFSVDSIPSNADKIGRPELQGIYVYQNDSLMKISGDQSEEKFYSLKRNGFYFLPNSGRFFKRYSIESIE